MGTNIKRHLRKDDAKTKLKKPNRIFTRQDSFRLVCYKSSGSAAAGPNSVTVSVRKKRGMGKRREVGQLACSRAPPLSSQAPPSPSVNSVVFSYSDSAWREVTVSCPRSLILKRPSPHPQLLGKGQNNIFRLASDIFTDYMQ